MKCAIFGDSHAADFTDLFDNNQELSLDVFPFPASSCKGLNNNKSVTQTHILIENILNSINFDIVFFKFGQVDIEIMSYITKSSFSDFLHKSVSSYVLFLKRIQLKFINIKFIVLSINPPTIKYNNLVYIQNIITNSFGNLIISENKNINYSLEERTIISNMFNMLISFECRSSGIQFHSYFDELLNNKIIDRKFLSHEFTDHHIGEHYYVCDKIGRMKVMSLTSIYTTNLRNILKQIILTS